MKHLTTPIITLIIAVVLFPASMSAQDANELMYKAYLTRSETDWKKALETRKAAADADKKNSAKQFDLAFTYFSLLNGTMATPNEDMFDEYVDDAKELIDKLIESNPKSGIAKSMLANIYGNEIGHSPMKGMLLGSKASSNASKGKELEPTSPLTWHVYAVNKYYTPSSFGGSPKEAAENAQKAVELMEANPLSLKNNWLYLDALVILGKAHQKLENKAGAIAAWEKARSREPGFKYAEILIANARR